MKQGWVISEFEKCLKKITYTNKIQKKDFNLHNSPIHKLVNLNLS